MAASRRLAIGAVAAVLAMAACSGEPSTTASIAPQTTRPTQSTLPPTTAGASTTSTTPAATPAPTVAIDPTAALGYTFHQVSRRTEAASVSITYPALIDLGDGAEADINRALEDWAEQLADEFATRTEGSGAGKASILEVELAPEVRSRTVFSISGLQFEFDAASDFSITRRVGWIFSIDDGRTVAATDLIADRTLNQLAASARRHLIADVLGDEELLTAPEGLAPTAENFDAVWLTPVGVAVGFDQYQVAAAEAGSPAVLIPYPELADAIDQNGVLAGLRDGNLPTGI